MVIYLQRYFKKINVLSLFFILIFLSACCCHKHNSAMPKGFVFLSDVDNTIVESARYYSDKNFLGKPVAGYTTPKIICTREAAIALKSANIDLKNKGYKLVVYDGYRPQVAVNEFMHWSKDSRDQIAKPLYYPNINKKDVFKLGYVTQKSSHSRGSAFDLTIIPMNDRLQELKITTRKLSNGDYIPYLDDNTVDMGSSFDLFHVVSHHDTDLISPRQSIMRNILREAMQKNGFKEYKEEWWHYTLKDEPYPTTYFNFTIKP